MESVTRGNVTEVKVLLATVALALGGYQVMLAAVGYGRLRPRFLTAAPALRSHRAVGDTLFVLLLVVGGMCLAVYGFDDDGMAHGLAGLALFAVLGLKIGVVRRDLGLGRFLPILGAAVLVLLGVTWALSAGGFLA